MNYIPGPGNRYRQKTRPPVKGARRTARLCTLIGVAVILGCSCSAPASESVTGHDAGNPKYSVEFRVTPKPDQGSIGVELHLKQSQHLLREFRMRVPAEHFSKFEADGQLAIDDGELLWRPPQAAGRLAWEVRINHARSGDAYDAYMDDEWALFRASDIIPPAATRTLRNANSRTTLVFELPARWSSVTQYGGDHRYSVNNPERRYDRPTGWILLGRIGTRTEEIAGTRVTIAAPRNHGARRMDMLALLQWTMPEITRVFENFPERLTIFSAGDPMWRGGLSAPASLYVHASRPLLSENATSTMIHELVHVAMGATAESGADWIIEGIAEYYSLLFLHRSGTISQHRFDIAMAKLDAWGNDADTLCSETSSGPVTAKAAALMHRLDRELRESTAGRIDLDDVTRVLANQRHKVKISDLTDIVSELLQKQSSVLRRAKIADCSIAD